MSFGGTLPPSCPPVSENLGDNSVGGNGGLQKGSAQNLLLKEPPWGAAPGKVRLAKAEGKEPILGVQVSVVLAECSLSEGPVCTGIFTYVGLNQLSQMPPLAPSAHLLSVPGILHGPHSTEHDGEPGPPECLR